MSVREIPITTEYRKYLDPATLAKFSSLEIIARLVVEGFITGLHKSPYHGFSVEFAEHRQYMPGDEIRRMDWKVFARTDRYYIKQFEEETNLKCYLLLDCSGSMHYSSHTVSKLQYASYLSASLAYLMTRQQDAVGLAIFDNEIQQLLPPKATLGYLKNIQEVLEHVAPERRETDISATLHNLAERIKRRGLIVLLSDLFDDPDKVISGLKHFRHLGHEIVVFHILDPQELNFHFEGDTIFEDLESGERLSSQPIYIRKEYQKLMGQFLLNYKRKCFENHIDYCQIETSKPFDIALLEYLIKRSKISF